jgi:hypothetical protein
VHTRDEGRRCVHPALTSMDSPNTVNKMLAAHDRV